MLFITAIIFIFTSFSYSNEKDAYDAEISFSGINNKNNQNHSSVSSSDYLNNLNYYASGSESSFIAQRRAGLGLLIAGGATLGLFYLVGIIATAGSWAIVDKSESDYELMGASIGVSFIPVVGLFIVPHFAYQAFNNDGAIFGSAARASSIGTVAACIIVNFFQITGLIMLIAGAVLWGTAESISSKSSRVSILYYSERKLNNATKDYNDNLTLGLSFKL